MPISKCTRMAISKGPVCLYFFLSLFLFLHSSATSDKLNELEKLKSL